MIPEMRNDRKIYKNSPELFGGIGSTSVSSKYLSPIKLVTPQQLPRYSPSTEQYHDTGQNVGGNLSKMT